MIRAMEVLRLYLVDVRGAGRARSKPFLLGNHLRLASAYNLARRVGEDRLEFYTRQSSAL